MIPKDKKEYEILEMIILNIMYPQGHNPEKFLPEDPVRIIVEHSFEGSEVYLLYKGKKYITADGPDLIDYYVREGNLKEIRKKPK